MQYNFQTEKNDSISLFETDLVNVLEMDERENNEILINYNLTLSKLLLDDKKFKKELEKALYKNSEKLTHKEFILDGKPKTPSIRNWLADFIKQKGSDMFNNLVLSQYIINSENVKKLDEEEKKSLKKLLTLYRNLKFFPESMPTDDGANWEIIPVENKEEMTKARTVKMPVVDKKENNEINELKNMLENYPEGSLERKAIEEEIEKMKV